MTTYTFDAAGRIATVAQKPDPVGQPTLVYTTALVRDDNGNATRVTQANGALTDYAYDALDRLSSMTTHPATGTNLVTSYTLDGNGNTLTRTTADAVVTTYSYDNLSRLTQVAATGLSTIGYAYDELSRRTSMTDGIGTTTYAYDRMGRMTQAAQPNGTLAYAYDLDSNRTTLTYPGPSAVTYSYSNAGRLSSLVDWDSRTTSYTYSAAGLAKTATLPNGLVTTYTYDRAQRLTNLTNLVGSTTITSHAYTLDSEGNRTSQSEFVSGITTGSSDSFGYTYDGLNRLTGVTTTNAESFTLDAASNVASRTGPAATYSYDTSNRLTGDGSQSFTWSQADRLTNRASDTFAYDALDRLTSSTVSGTTRTYAYNGDGLLQSRNQGTTTTFLWDPATDPSRELRQGSDSIVYGLGPLYVIKADTTTVTLASDGGQSVRAEANSGGSVTAAFRYRTYGQIAQATAGPPAYLGFAGQLLDSSGLVYMRARWYEASIGRFVSRDPVAGSAGEPFTLNVYTYAQANPIRKADPSGRFCLLIGVGSKVAAGATGSSGEGTGAAAAENWSLAFCNDRVFGDKGSVGLVNTSAHFASDKTSVEDSLVEGVFAGFGLQLGISPQANRAEDLQGIAASQGADMGYIWPVDLGYDWTHSNEIDTWTVTLTVVSAGIGLDYTQMPARAQARTFWSIENGWGWALR